jgi:hypothetical protein
MKIFLLISLLFLMTGCIAYPAYYPDTYYPSGYYSGYSGYSAYPSYYGPDVSVFIGGGSYGHGHGGGHGFRGGGHGFHGGHWGGWRR